MRECLLFTAGGQFNSPFEQARRMLFHPDAVVGRFSRSVTISTFIRKWIADSPFFHEFLDRAACDSFSRRKKDRKPANDILVFAFISRAVSVVVEDGDLGLDEQVHASHSFARYIFLGEMRVGEK